MTKLCPLHSESHVVLNRDPTFQSTDPETVREESPRADSGCEPGPGRRARRTVHLELVVHAANALFTEHGLLLSRVVSVHDKSQLTNMGMLFRASHEVSPVESDESSLHS